MAKLDEVVLKRHLLATRNSQPGPHRVVAHRDEAYAQPKSARDIGGGLRKRRPFTHPAGPVKVSGQICVPEPEPGRCAEAVQGLHGPEGVTFKTPAGDRVSRSGEGVSDRVEIRAYVKSVELGVIAGVYDSDYPARIEDCLQAGQHPGRADAAAKDRDHEPAWPTYLTTEAIPISRVVQGFQPRWRAALLGSSALRFSSPGRAAARRAGLLGLGAGRV